MKILVALTAINLVVSGATLAIVIVGGHKLRTEAEAMKMKSRTSFMHLKSALAALED